MTDFSSAIESIRRAAETAGLSGLAREAGVPLTTVRSFADRHWTHKNLDTLEKLAGAAKRINRRKREDA